MLSVICEVDKGPHSYALGNSNYEYILCKKLIGQRKDTKLLTAVTYRLFMGIFSNPPFLSFLASN